MFPTGAAAHHETEISVSPGNSAILNIPIDNTAPPGPLLIDEHSAAIETLHARVNKHLVKSNDDITVKGTLSGRSIPNAPRAEARVARRNKEKRVVKKLLELNCPGFHILEKKSVPRGAVTKALIMTMRHIRSTVRCLTGKYGRIPESCNQLLR